MHSSSSPSLNTGDSAKAFALVIAAGAATGIGAAVVFFPQLGAKLSNHKTLAGSLGFAAGVMLYVSLVDIYGKSITGFEEQGHDPDMAFNCTTITFFAGIILMKIVDMIVHFLLGKENNYLIHTHPPVEHQDDGAIPTCSRTTTKHSSSSEVDCCSDPDCEDKQQSHSNNNVDDGDEEGEVAQRGNTDVEGGGGDDDGDAVVQQQSIIPPAPPKKELFHMGLSTAIAIALHNLPEGLVTFLAYVDEPAVGVALAIGIAIHNIPEGLCVAMPIFYATGSRWKAFWWGILSGVSEPIGALIGWVVLKGSFSGNTYGILFGLVAGIMVFISIDDLLPTAYRHDKAGNIVTPTVIVGMLLIALSLILFSI